MVTGGLRGPDRLLVGGDNHLLTVGLGDAVPRGWSWSPWTGQDGGGWGWSTAHCCAW